MQEQQQLLASYQSLVVKQLVSQSHSSKLQADDDDKVEEQDEEVRGVRMQLAALTPQLKDLMLSQGKTAVTED